MINTFYKNSALLLFAAVFLFGCTDSKDKFPNEWSFDKSEITDNQPASTEKLNVDVYLDVTGSMEGFAGSSSTNNFGKLLDDIESTCQNTWKKTDIKYYKYGSRVDTIQRAEFVSAKSDRNTFKGKDINNKTDFTNAIQNTDPKRVSIFITDLFYNNNDVNSVVAAIKERSIKNGIEIGVVGLSSDFDGCVGDLGPGVPCMPVKAPRQIFALVFGDKTNIGLFWKSLSKKSYIMPSQFLLLTNKPTTDFTVKLDKDRKSKSINKSSLPKKDWEKYETIYAFTMKEREKEALLHLDMTLQSEKDMPVFTEKNLKTMVFKRSAASKDSVAADNEVKFSNLKFSGKQLTADVELSNTDPEGKYSYAVYLGLDNTIPLLMPAWVKKMSTDSNSDVKDGKTLNLEKLLTDISTSHVTARQPKIAKFYIYLEKK
ncbi:hypothetical protein [Dyadobacter sp. NIV53]|uniref:hypothetical protein n=1 Tax=Dyadobacter sp. NIV53 TaxID=2861765 RepID=UPI001C8842F6|nr:hypothetical protein [Dyadobacter sp. NIV53]